MVIASERVHSEHPWSSFYRSVNGIERALLSNLARLPAISSFWTQFVGEPKESHALVIHEGHSTAAVQRLSGITVCHLVSIQLVAMQVNAFATSIIF